MRILIIDDDDDLRTLLAHFVRQEWPDARIEQFNPMERELPEAESLLGAYDTVILDYMLGRGDGLQWLAEFKKRPDCPPVLFLTGAGNEIIAVRAMKAGADDYQRKQELSRDKLITSIRNLIEKRAMERTLDPKKAEQFAAHAMGAGGKVRIPGIRVLHPIGEGGMSHVYLASREADDEPLVVKILRSDVTADPNQLERFLEEYAMVERIQSRHVARIFGHGTSENLTYLVMEFFEGGDLNKRLAGRALPSDEALRLFRELMFALGDIHEKGILHRDLKPQNLMFRTDGSLAIVDFGIAKNIDAIDRTGHGEVLGTPRYMSPEQVQGRALDMRTDIYSAGVLLYQMLTGSHLFDGANAMEVAMQHVNAQPPALPEHLERYQRLMDKLIEKDRDARFRNADEVIGFLSRKYFQETAPAKADVTSRLHR